MRTAREWVLAQPGGLDFDAEELAIAVAAVEARDREVVEADARRARAMTPEAMVEALRAAADRIPVGGTVRVKGGAPISGFNLAAHLVRIIEDAEAGRDVYRHLCDQPATRARFAAEARQ